MVAVAAGGAPRVRAGELPSVFRRRAGVWATPSSRAARTSTVGRVRLRGRTGPGSRGEPAEPAARIIAERRSTGTPLAQHRRRVVRGRRLGRRPSRRRGHRAPAGPSRARRRAARFLPWLLHTAVTGYPRRSRDRQSLPSQVHTQTSSTTCSPSASRRAPDITPAMGCLPCRSLPHRCRVPYARGTTFPASARRGRGE